MNLTSELIQKAKTAKSGQLADEELESVSSGGCGSSDLVSPMASFDCERCHSHDFELRYQSFGRLDRYNSIHYRICKLCGWYEKIDRKYKPERMPGAKWIQ